MRVCPRVLPVTSRAVAANRSEGRSWAAPAATRRKACPRERSRRRAYAMRSANVRGQRRNVETQHRNLPLQRVSRARGKREHDPEVEGCRRRCLRKHKRTSELGPRKWSRSKQGARAAAPARVAQRRTLSPRDAAPQNRHLQAVLRPPVEQRRLGDPETQRHARFCLRAKQDIERSLGDIAGPHTCGLDVHAVGSRSNAPELQRDRRLRRARRCGTGTKRVRDERRDEQEDREPHDGGNRARPASPGRACGSEHSSVSRRGPRGPFDPPGCSIGRSHPGHAVTTSFGGEYHYVCKRAQSSSCDRRNNSISETRSSVDALCSWSIRSTTAATSGRDARPASTRLA